GADGEVRDDEELQGPRERQRIELLELRSVEPARSNYNRNTLLKCGAGIVTRSIRLREIDRRIDPGELHLLPTPDPQHLMPGRCQRRCEHRADSAAVPKQRDFPAARANSGLTRSTAA